MVVVLRNNNGDDLPAFTRRLHAEQQKSDPLIAHFLAATVSVERDESGDGLLIHQRPDHSRWVHAYTVADWIPGVDVGQDVDYATMTGQQLLALLPGTVGIRLDEGRHHTRDVVMPLAEHHQQIAAPPADDHPARRRGPYAGPDVVREARAVHSGTGSRERVLAALRQTCVFVGRQADSVPVAMLAERGNWLCVFSSALLLQTELGHDSRHILVAGCDLLDVLLPALTVMVGPIGVFVDLGADHQLSLPASLIAAGQSPSVPAAGSTDGGQR
jgi:hypothetical protein